jgi:hypothetical protein
MTDYPPADDRLRHLLAQEINTRIDTWKLAFVIAGLIVDSPEVRAEVDRIGAAHAAGQPCGDRNCPRCFGTQLAAGVRDAARQASGQQPAAEAAPWFVEGRHGPTPEEMTSHVTSVGRCPVMFQGGGRCEKNADHRPPGSDDPHTPEPAVGVQDATQPTTDETEQTARDDLYDALDQSWYRWDPQSMAKGTAIIRLIDAYRAAILRGAADAVAAHPEAQDEHMGGMDRAADIVRRLATGAGS